MQTGDRWQQIFTFQFSVIVLWDYISAHSRTALLISRIEQDKVYIMTYKRLTISLKYFFIDIFDIWFNNINIKKSFFEQSMNKTD